MPREHLGKVLNFLDVIRSLIECPKQWINAISMHRVGYCVNPIDALRRSERRWAYFSVITSASKGVIKSISPLFFSPKTRNLAILRAESLTFSQILSRTKP